MQLTMADMFPRRFESEQRHKDRPTTKPPKSTTTRDGRPVEKKTKPQGKIVATYDYLDSSGALLFQVVRLDPKGFRQRRPDGNGGWIWSLGDTPRILYRLPELLAVNSLEWIFIVEGEKDVHSLESIDLAATCNPGGAGKWHTLLDDSALHGRHVVILVDNDKAGWKHAEQVAQALYGKTAEVRIVGLPGLPEKGDVTDWLESLDGKESEELAAELVRIPL